MTWRRFVPFLLLGACLCLTVYIVITPPKATASNCCQFPTAEQENTGGSNATVAWFEMQLSDPQGTNFSAQGDTSSGEVGESTPIPGDDGCYDQAKKLGYSPPGGAAIAVTTPEPRYWWDVGQVGTWDGASGALNTVNPTSQYNGFGYDGVGYTFDAVYYYRYQVAGMTFPCGFSFTQAMANYCTLTFYWRRYVENDLTALIYTSPSNYVIDCKNMVCEDISQ
ncbi:MAG: hypothetical protein ACRD2G_11535 [Terriglobia bacterium]